MGKRRKLKKVLFVLVLFFFTSVFAQEGKSYRVVYSATWYKTGKPDNNDPGVVLVHDITGGKSEAENAAILKAGFVNGHTRHNFSGCPDEEKGRNDEESCWQKIRVLSIEEL
jgi:hypothetical protein